MDIEERAITAAVSAVDEQRARNEVVLASGVAFDIQKVSPLLMRQAYLKLERPTVPKFYDQDNDRYLENPNDPDYQKALLDFEEAQEQTVWAVLILAGTRIKSVPDGLPNVDDDSWLEAIDAMGINVDVSTKSKRYLAWVRYIAIRSIEDMTAISSAISRASGVLETDVDNSIDSFRSDEIRPADPSSELPASNVNGHSVPTPAGRAGV